MSVKKSKSLEFDPGWCRCCGGMQKCRVINIEYECFGHTETYCDILMDCFGLMLTHLDGEVNEQLICTICIKKLREAFKFYQQILRCEEVFIQMKMDNTNTETGVNEATEMDDPNIELEFNMETSDTELSSSRDMFTDDGLDCVSACDLNSEQDEYNSNDDLPLNSVITENSPIQIRDEDKVATDNQVRKGLDTCQRSTLISRHPKVPARKLKPLSVNGATTSQRLSKSQVQFPKLPQTLSTESDCEAVKKCKNDLFETKKKMAHILNISTLLQHSNATPFKRKTHLGIRCYYCRFILENFDKLKDHQAAQHQKTDLKKILSGFDVECLIVNVDITDLKCTICNESIPNLNELKSHLIQRHNKTMYTEYGDRVIPFNISSPNVYVCQICGFQFKIFGAIERHMNVHFRNYVCKECGNGFVSKYRLKVHTNSMHVVGKFPCDVCKKIFTTKIKQKNHVNTVHKLMKRFKCPKCPQRFSEYFRRQKHLVEVHAVAPLQHICNMCDKIFDRRHTLSRHIKREHLKQRNLQCKLCPYKCFTNNELRVHMIKHNGERVHECSVCKKSYARKKTLREHMRIHNNDRRFACAECGQTFVQKCSLKGHMKTQHLK